MPKTIFHEVDRECLLVTLRSAKQRGGSKTFTIIELCGVSENSYAEATKNAVAKGGMPDEAAMPMQLSGIGRSFSSPSSPRPPAPNLRRSRSQ